MYVPFRSDSTSRQILYRALSSSTRIVYWPGQICLAEWNRRFAHLASRARRTESWRGSYIVTCFCVLKFPLPVIRLIHATETKRLTTNMSMAICLPLSWKLLIYARETLFVASDKTPS